MVFSHDRFHARNRRAMAAMTSASETFRYEPIEVRFYPRINPDDMDDMPPISRVRFWQIEIQAAKPRFCRTATWRRRWSYASCCSRILVTGDFYVVKHSAAPEPSATAVQEQADCFEPNEHQQLGARPN